VSVLGSTDGAFGRVVNRRRVLDGRLPRAGAPDEVALSKALADIREGDEPRMTVELAMLRCARPQPKCLTSPSSAWPAANGATAGWMLSPTG
jgi:hypothetical protein